MGQRLVIGPFSKGLRNDVTPFNIDNESFPVLINAYQWRGRVKRKRGTKLFTRLQRFFNSTDISYNTGTTTITLDGSGSANILINASWTLQTNATLVPGTVTITIGVNVYTDPNKDGTLTGPNPGTINYASGVITIPLEAGNAASVKFVYFPDLPVMGLEDFYANSAQFPSLIGFDPKFSYNILTSIPTLTYDVSFYKNPAVSASFPGYVPKTNPTPTSWNGQDYQQFWTTNYQGALWATNGIDVPFTGSSIGMQFSPVTNVAAPVGNTVVITVTGANLVPGDFVFLNEFDPAIITGINFQTGYVTAGTAPGAITITLPNATLAGPGGATTKGIVQYLTNRSDKTKDCIRWYDGDPTNGSATNPILNGVNGWVNFQPPLSNLNFSIADAPLAQYYLVGAKMIVGFKDRLLFFGPVIQTSVTGAAPIYLKDTVIYSQNGTPYYTASFTNTPDATKDTSFNSTTLFFPILVPINQTATAPAYFEDVAGFGGFLSSALDQDINTVAPNEDVLIVGFTRRQTRLIYTGNDLIPFNFYVINSELGSGSTFSAITMDKGIISKGSRGFVVTSQVETTRIDLEIPDEVFQVSLFNNGSERVCAQRDYINEWIYFTYPVNTISYIYPNQTLQYNYRDNSWAIFLENYTRYGTLRQSTQFTWATVGTFYPTWSAWNIPWNAGASNSLQPKVIAGNQQGFVMLRDDGTDEDASLMIQNIVGSTITSANHCLNDGDYILIENALGTVGAAVNGKIFKINTASTNAFNLFPPLSSGFTYLGNGTITRMYVPFIQSKQFPLAWNIGRKTRIGPQAYLLTKTDTPNSQITLNIFLSQDANNPYNAGGIVPDVNSVNNALIYSSTLFTGPELYIQNCNKQSLGTIGNGIATIFTFNYFTLFNIEFASIVPSSVFIQVGSVATFTDNGNGGFTATGTGTSIGSSIDYNSGVVLLFFTAPPISQITTTNFNYYVNDILSPTASSQSQVWHRINTSLLGDTVQLGFTLSDAQMTDTTFANQFEEIELHSIVIDTSPSQVLV